MTIGFGVSIEGAFCSLFSSFVQCKGSSFLWAVTLDKFFDSLITSLTGEWGLWPCAICAKKMGNLMTITSCIACLLVWVACVPPRKVIDLFNGWKLQDLDLYGKFLWRMLPCSVCWFLQREGNYTIFEDIFTSAPHVIHCIKDLMFLCFQSSGVWSNTI